jgi:hypothetical protein
LEALSQEFEDSEESPDVKPKKRDKDGEIKITSMAAKKRIELEDKEIGGAISGRHPPHAGPAGEFAGGGGPAAKVPQDKVIGDPRKDPNMPQVSNNGAIAIGMFTLWRQVRMGANPPAENETCQALREELVKHGLRPKAKATKPELVIWVKTCWRVWRRYLLWRRGLFADDPRKLEMDDQLRIAQTNAPSFAMSVSLRQEMKSKMAAAKTEKERVNISHNYRSAGDPFYHYFPPRLEIAGGVKMPIVPFKAGKQVLLGDLMREGKVEDRTKLAKLQAEDVAAARRAQHASLRPRNCPALFSLSACGHPCDHEKQYIRRKYRVEQAQTQL